MVMEAQSTTKSKLQAFFIFSFYEGYVFGFRLPEKTHSNHRQYFGGGKSPRLGPLPVIPLSITPKAHSTRAV